MRVVLVPIKSFRESKLRLAGVLDETERGALVQLLAARVLAAAGDTPTFVACDDAAVADWAVAHGAYVLFTPHLGLSGAVTTGVEHLSTRGATLVVIAHADLPFAHSLSTFGHEGEVTLAPDRRLDGTNVAAVPASAGFRFAYGKSSFSRHCQEAERLGLRRRTVYDTRLAADIDLPSDLAQIGDLLTDLTHAEARAEADPLFARGAPT